MYSENGKTLMKEIEGNTHRGKDTPCLLTGATPFRQKLHEFYLCWKLSTCCHSTHKIKNAPLSSSQQMHLPSPPCEQGKRINTRKLG